MAIFQKKKKTNRNSHIWNRHLYAQYTTMCWHSRLWYGDERDSISRQFHIRQIQWQSQKFSTISFRDYDKKIKRFQVSRLRHFRFAVMSCSPIQMNRLAHTSMAPRSTIKRQINWSRWVLNGSAHRGRQREQAEHITRRHFHSQINNSNMNRSNGLSYRRHNWR